MISPWREVTNLQMTLIPNLLRRFRKAAGYSQKEAAQLLGLQSAASLSRWERGQRTPSIIRLLELSCLYSRLVNDLLRPQFLEARERIHARRKELNHPR